MSVVQMNILNLISHGMYKLLKAPIRGLKVKKKMMNDKGKDSSDELKGMVHMIAM